MKFDLFKAMANLKKEFGNDAEMLLTQNGSDGINVRLSLFKNDELYNTQFAVTRKELLYEEIGLMNIKFKDSVAVLKRIE